MAQIIYNPFGKGEPTVPATNLPEIEEGTWAFENVKGVEMIVHQSTPMIMLQVIRPTSKEQYDAALDKIEKSLVWHVAIPENMVILYFAGGNDDIEITQANYKDVASLFLGLILQAEDWWKKYGK